MKTAAERFLKYVTFGTASDENSQSCPSTAGQLTLGEYLVQELKDIGLSDPHTDQNGYVYGWLAATEGREDEPCIGLIAHMDTSPDAPGDNVKPQVVMYSGGDIVLLNGDTVKLADNPILEGLRGEALIVTDGNTLLGADDKAGVAEIFAACEYLKDHAEISHPKIAVCITPDEEIGRGADRFDVAKFGASYAYTVDGGSLGEIEYENFNAASAHITVRGVNIHPGEAKGKMKNAVLMANEYISLLPEKETPAHTEGYEGFYHVSDISGCESRADIYMIIRDHDRRSFENRKRVVAELCDSLNRKWGNGCFMAEICDSYYNMKEMILPHMHLITRAEAAFKGCGVEPRIIAIRGGTDGARLSYMGLPCPNISTGGVNFHSTREFIPVSSLEKMTEVIVNIVSFKG